MNRRETLHHALRAFAPSVPAWEAGEIVAHCLVTPSMHRMPATAAVRLAAVAFARHACTEYDTLLAEGYGPEAARHFTAAAIDAVLESWGARSSIGAPPPD